MPVCVLCSLKMQAITRMYQYFLQNLASIFMTEFELQIKIKDLSHLEKREIHHSQLQLKLKEKNQGAGERAENSKSSELHKFDQEQI